MGYVSNVNEYVLSDIMRVSLQRICASKYGRPKKSRISASTIIANKNILQGVHGWMGHRPGVIEPNILLKEFNVNELALWF